MWLLIAESKWKSELFTEAGSCVIDVLPILFYLLDWLDVHTIFLQLLSMLILWEMQNRSKLFLWNCIHQNFGFLRIWWQWKRAGNTFMFVDIWLQFQYLKCMLLLTAGVVFIDFLLELLSYLNNTDKINSICVLWSGKILLASILVGCLFLNMITPVC